MRRRLKGREEYRLALLIAADQVGARLRAHADLVPFGQLAQNQSRNFLRCEFLAVQRYGLLSAHLALDAAHGALRIERLLVARRLAHQQIAGCVEPYTGRQYPLVAGPQYLDLSIHKRGDLRICGS